MYIKITSRLLMGFMTSGCTQPIQRSFTNSSNMGITESIAFRKKAKSKKRQPVKALTKEQLQLVAKGIDSALKVNKLIKSEEQKD